MATFLKYCCCCCSIASVVSDSVRPHRRQPTRLSCSWYSPGKNTGVGCHFLLQCMKVKSESEVAQSCLTLCDPIDGSPPGSPVPGILQARTLEWVAISFSNGWKWKVKVKSLSRVRLFATPWTAAHQAPPSVGFSRQEYWRGVPLPSPFLMYGHFKNKRNGQNPNSPNTSSFTQKPRTRLKIIVKIILYYFPH